MTLRRFQLVVTGAVAALAIAPAAAMADGQTEFKTLSDAFNNVGIASAATFMNGNLDGGGQSYSSELLQQAGLTAGSAVTHGGLSFTWPSAAAGSNDNVVANGQTIDLTGHGNTLGFLGASDYGTSFGTGTINYTDGTQDQYTLQFNDWWAANGAAGSDVVASTQFFYSASQVIQPDGVDVYYASVPVDPTKTVASITLPQVSDGATKGTAAMHIFAIALGTSGS